MATIDKTAVEKFVKRMTTRFCENDHPIESGKAFCSECGKGVKPSTMTETQRLDEVEAVLAEMLNVGATPDKTDDNAFWAKVRAAGKYLVTPQISKKEK